MTITPAEKAYQDWVDEGTNRYGTVHRDAYLAGYEAGGMIAPLECITEQEKKAFAFGWWKALEVNRKEWSGLTTGEIVGLTDHIRLEDLGCFILVARVIESKLKEKNYD